jgi:beta-xylosidase
MLFVYFRDPANMGVFFALSDDGYHWKALNGDKPWMGIGHPGELMRDPFLTRGADGEFHMVWTWAWRGQTLGYAHSRDLVHWSEQKEIPIMAGIEGAKNTWAPEIYWDAAKSKWLIIWSSVVEGKHAGNRIYSAFTTDFASFSKPEIFYDPGFEVIDATILHTRGRYYMVFKDERPEPVRKWLQVTSGPTLEGPWGSASEPFTESWSEGPSAMELGASYVVYYDHYRDPKRYEAVRSSDLIHWTPILGEIQFPAGAKHGSFLKITAAERRVLEQAGDR